MRNGVFPLEYHDIDDDTGSDTGSDPDDASDAATATTGDRFVAFGEQGPGRHGNADAAQPGILERQYLH